MSDQHVSPKTSSPSDADLGNRRTAARALSSWGSAGIRLLILLLIGVLTAAVTVQNQACMLAYIDSFMVLGFAVIGALLLMLLLRDPPAHLEQPAARK
jgi:hypothetical protein